MQTMPTADELREAIITESSTVLIVDVNASQINRIASAIKNEKQYTIWNNRRSGLEATGSGAITIDEQLTSHNRAVLEGLGYTVTDLPIDPTWVSSEALAPKHKISW
jgi:hypothetical protein